MYELNMSETIRHYGSGKFSTVLDEYVWSVSLGGGCDDEIDSETGCGTYYGLMRGGRSIFRDHDPLLETLNAAEQEQLTGCAGVIVSESSDGFVSVDYLDTDEELDAAWDALTAELSSTADEYASDRCDQCEAVMINMVFCHEHGCPNRLKVYRDGSWVSPQSDEEEATYE